MTFKDNLKTKILLDKLLGKILDTIIEVSGQRRVDKVLTRQLLAMTDLEAQKVRDLNLYVRSSGEENMEVLVLDNDLPVYHTNVEDVVLRKSPVWQEMLSIRNIKKILNDKDVVASKGKESLKWIHANAVALLDLTPAKDDLASLLDDARQGLEGESITRIQEPLDLFFEILDFQSVSIGGLDPNLRIFAQPKSDGGDGPLFEHLILFDLEKGSLSLKEGVFSPRSDVDLAWIRQYTRGEESADLQGIEVFAFLHEQALKKTSG